MILYDTGVLPSSAWVGRELGAKHGVVICTPGSCACRDPRTCRDAVACETRPTKGTEHEMKVYLAGPMRGYERYNFPAFTAACSALRVAGYSVLSPHERDLDEGFDPEKSLQDQSFDLKAALLWDMQAVLSSDAVVLMPGWEQSRGAVAEKALADAAGIPWMTLSAAVAGAA